MACEIIEIIVDFQEKGDKGDPFTFEDFTPEQIGELQQPAIDAAVIANDAADNANAATQNAVSATNDAIQAATNAETATDLANDATDNANTATGLANIAANNANDKANLADLAAISANDAADVANNAKGWSPVDEVEEYQGKELRKITGYIGGTGDEPTDNVGLYFAVGGGFTSDPDLAVNFKGDDGDSIVNLNPESSIPQARIWIGTQGQFDQQQPLPSDVATLILRND